MESDDHKDGLSLYSTSMATAPSPDGSRGKPKKGLKRFPRVLKAILFETSLAKKIRKRKNTQKGGGNIHVTTIGNVDPTNLSSEQNPSISNDDGSLAGGGSISSSSTFAGSNNSSTNSRSSAGEIILTQQEEQCDGKSSTPTPAGKGRYSSNNVGLCLILVSLLVLVLWGKAFAIVFTSTWLFFVPRCITGSLSRKIGAYCRKVELGDQNRARRWVAGFKRR